MRLRRRRLLLSSFLLPHLREMASRRTSTSEGHAGIHWQANYLQQPATDSPHATTTRVEPHRAAADAALARQTGRPLIPVTHSSDGVFTPLALDQRPFYRLLDEQVSTLHILQSTTEPVPSCWPRRARHKLYQVYPRSSRSSTTSWTLPSRRERQSTDLFV